MVQPKFIVPATFAFLLTLGGCGSEPSATVATVSGPVRGLISDDTSLYRGIPYAAPPLDDLRWRRPAPAAAWTDVLDTTETGPACWQEVESNNAEFLERLTRGAGMGGFTRWMLGTFAQFVIPDVSEDCLTLNVASPLGAEGLPVMFWIHGGGHQFGSGGGPYESTSLAAKGVVLVSLNYRLGLYGYLAHPELAAEDPDGSTGNYGTLDQIAALEWVRDNIAAFGGDPDNVTIFGESAGGHSVGQLMASPLAHGLFHRAIAQSGTGFQQFQDIDEAHERMSGFEGGRRLAQLAGVSGEHEILALRKMSTDELREVAADEALVETLHPQVDGYVLPQATAVAFASGLQAAVPLVVGSNADEGSILYGFGMSPVDGRGSDNEPPETVAEWDAMLDDKFGDNAEAVGVHYPVDRDVDVRHAGEVLMGDAWFGRHAFYMAQAHSEAGHPTYLYFYERRPPSDEQTIGASHALEISHVFGGLIPGWPWDERDDELQAEMQGYWATFAASGDPNTVGLPAWPGFNDLEAQELGIGHEATQGRRVTREDRYRAMWGELNARIARTSAASAASGH